MGSATRSGGGAALRREHGLSDATGICRGRCTPGAEAHGVLTDPTTVRLVAGSVGGGLHGSRGALLLTLVADVRLGTALRRACRRLAGAARIAPWHSQAQYEAARSSSDDALAAYTHADPQARPRACLPRSASETLSSRTRPSTPRSCSSRTTWGRAVRSGSSDPVAASAAFQNSKLAAERALQLKPTRRRRSAPEGSRGVKSGDNAAAIATLEPLWNIDTRFPKPGSCTSRCSSRQGYDERASKVKAALQVGFPRNAVIEEEMRSWESSSPTP